MPRDRRFRPKDHPDGCRKIMVLHERHHEIIRRLVIGQLSKDIAADLGMSDNAVRAIKSSPIVKQQLAVMKGERDARAVDIGEDIHELAIEGVMVLRKILRREGDFEGGSPALVAKVAMDALDRDGHSAVLKHQGEVLHAHFTATELDDIKQRAAIRAVEEGVKDGLIVDNFEVVEEVA